MGEARLRGTSFRSLVSWPAQPRSAATLRRPGSEAQESDCDDQKQRSVAAGERQALRGGRLCGSGSATGGNALSPHRPALPRPLRTRGELRPPRLLACSPPFGGRLATVGGRLAARRLAGASRHRGSRQRRRLATGRGLPTRRGVSPPGGVSPPAEASRHRARGLPTRRRRLATGRGVSPPGGGVSPPGGGVSPPGGGVSPPGGGVSPPGGGVSPPGGGCLPTRRRLSPHRAGASARPEVSLHRAGSPRPVVAVCPPPGGFSPPGGCSSSQGCSSSVPSDGGGPPPGVCPSGGGVPSGPCQPGLPWSDPELTVVPPGVSVVGPGTTVVLHRSRRDPTRTCHGRIRSRPETSGRRRQMRHRRSPRRARARWQARRGP